MLKLIVGAANTIINGWIATDEKEFNILARQSWKNNYREGTFSHILAEHVWEHFSFYDGLVAAKNCFYLLEDWGLLRIAVPDGNFRNDKYQNMIKVGGPGPSNHPAASHKVVYTYDKLLEILNSAGFVCELLEYCDEKGVFHYKYWNEVDGKIGRSFRYDSRNSKSSLGMVSIIVDAKKEIVVNKP